MYSLIIFDWDGTLIDSAQRIVSCMQAAMSGAGLPVRDDPAIRDIIGLGLPQAFAQLYPGIDLGEMERLRDYYSKHFIADDLAPSSFFIGVEETLSNLKADGYTLAVATGKSRKGLNRVLGEITWSDLFTTSRCADETQSKPHPQMLEELLMETGVNASRALMVGDTTYDMEMAQQAGVDRIAVSYGVHHPDRLQVFDPVLIIDQIAQLGDWLSRHRSEKL